MLPNYFKHVEEHENTLITKFFGLHRITLRGGKKVQFLGLIFLVSFLCSGWWCINIFIFRCALLSWEICSVQNYEFTVVMI